MKILFIGNSYTYYNDMPALFRALAEENGRAAEVDAVTKGGRKLYENLAAEDEKHAEIEALLAENKYDVLILQEQSYFSLIDYEKFEYGISELVRRVSAERSILYATWGRKKGAALLKERGWTPDEMTELLEDAYCHAAEASGAEVVPVGRCFRYVSEIIPDIDLYHPDLSHPSYAGSCVAAIALYRKIFGETPEKHSSLSLDDRSFDAITSVADENVF